MDAEEKRNLLAYLKGKFERGLPILFTGAGASRDTKNVRGQPVPGVADLKKELWKLCFPSDSFDETSSLQNLYDQSLRRHRSQLSHLLASVLSVDADSLPDFYETLFSMPWARCYTLNIDDLPLAVVRRFTLARPPHGVSATTQQDLAAAAPPSASLEYIYLNGSLADAPDHVTFSPTQYAERLARPDPFYLRLVGDLLSHPFIFLGTTLDESPLWQHIELRQPRGARALSELRPRSYLVTPTLDRAKLALLADFNVVWLPMSAEEFSREILLPIYDIAPVGISFLDNYARRPHPSGTPRLADVAELSRTPLTTTEFLLGQEPTWADLQSGRAVQREVDDDLLKMTRNALSSGKDPGVIVVEGTAGAGKSTSLRMLGLRLAAEGKHVGWVDRSSELSRSQLIRAMRGRSAPPILIVDDANAFGNDLGSMVREICLGKRQPLIVIAIRTSKAERLLTTTQLGGVARQDIVMPPLADQDIDGLLTLLTRENRLGILKGKARDDQVAAFRDQAGRQLLVAMIQATSGRRFEEKVVEELTDLNGEERHIYALIAVASAFRFPLERGDILIACGDRSNTALNNLESLVSKHIVSRIAETGTVQARHHRIAEILLDDLIRSGQLGSVLGGLILAVATKVTPSMPQVAAPKRFLRRLLNHRFLMSAVQVEGARNLYGEFEQLLNWDYHYWLQRGSLEVKYGDLNLAENCLNQARSLNGSDHLVLTEYAYLMFRQAVDSPLASGALELVTRATDCLESLIALRGASDSYPYHVLGSQGLAWARRALLSKDERAAYLTRLLGVMKDACASNASRTDKDAKQLKTLHDDIQRELWGLAIPAGR